MFVVFDVFLTYVFFMVCLYLTDVFYVILELNSILDGFHGFLCSILYLYAMIHSPCDFYIISLLFHMITKLLS